MLSPPADEAIDVVYTWVDDAGRGYGDLLRQYAADRHDLNPNRTRDNLQVLKYSLRSVARFLPWARRISSVTSRPQSPTWLTQPPAPSVHTTRFSPRDQFPPFNSFPLSPNFTRLPALRRHSSTAGAV